MSLSEEQTRFKIGDLVVINEPVEFIVYDMVVQRGDIGLIVGIEYDMEVMSVYGIDYIVMVRGRTLVFFDQELEVFDAKLDGNTKISY